ncbi:UDP-glucose 4-epimerase GalE [Palleronia caenipelagi]|uniref:UDP-glucose 4-epimerase n=1 Tax=Palleronia caenipelagi TaxID=2489174 RepID=A0A547QAB4_9RHOB|nr:UDP-glucose 4-epimerase GalE [Palleronia caenipelagi]TRD23321.1 UDP-glucose 4-epimerase GalE [Palleronia caenipelagi]
MRVFLTGGAGYIGSHTLLELLRQGHDVHIFDNFSNSSRAGLARVRELAGQDFGVSEGDIRDATAVAHALSEARPDAVIHFAGLKAVGESAQFPLRYYDVNVNGTLVLLDAMDAAGVRGIVFSSSATVYGDPDFTPITEDHPLRPANPYGRTKMMGEMIISDWAQTTDGASAILLRYFNPVGADASGRIGEDPSGKPENLMPYVTQVAVGRREALSVFGSDYPTRDGTGERDYIHITDLARSHVAAVAKTAELRGAETCNVGTGQGVTVLEMVQAFESANGIEIPHSITDRRPGDVATYVASSARAKDLLGWEAEFDIEEMCASAWNWQSKNPQGYRDD